MAEIVRRDRTMRGWMSASVALPISTVSAPRIGRTRPSRPNSPATRYPLASSLTTLPLAKLIPRAIARSKIGPSLRKSAGADRKGPPARGPAAHAGREDQGRVFSGCEPIRFGRNSPPAMPRLSILVEPSVGMDNLADDGRGGQRRPVPRRGARDRDRLRPEPDSARGQDRADRL